MFIFGTQYLRGFTPYPRDWERDFYTMREKGFNTVRAWLVWNRIQLSENQLDYEYINTFLDIAGKTGIQVGLLFQLHAAPEWLTKKYPQYYYVNAEGQAFEPAERPNTPSGGWPGLCFDNPEVKEIETEFIKNIVSNLSARKEIAFWEPMNEPHQWVDRAKNPVGQFCYCPASRERFRNWLKQKYGDIASLNYSWGRHHNSWDEVRPPTWRFGFTDYIDFRMFTIDSVRDEIRMRSDVIREYDNRPVIAHAWGGGTVTCPNIGAMAFDDWKNAEVFDKWGYSAFPDSYNQNVILGLGTDATRGAGQGKEIWQSELGTGDLGEGFKRKGRVKPEVLAGWTWESIRHGSKGVLYWQFRKESYGDEIGNVGLTDYAGNTTENLEMVSKICNVLNQNASLFNNSSVEPAKVGIVFSMRAYLANWCDLRDSNLCIDSMSGYYRMFWEDNIPVDILHEDFMKKEEIEKYTLVILPMPVALSENAKILLQDYVKKGGCILSDPYFCSWDKDFHLDNAIPGDGFDKVFGCHEKDIFSGNGVIPVSYKGKTYQIGRSQFKEKFIMSTGCELASYVDATGAAIVKNSFGKGTAIISGLNFGLSYSPGLGVGDEFVRNKENLVMAGAKHIVMDLVHELGIYSSIKQECASIQGSLLLNKEADDLLILMNNSEEAQKSNIQINGEYVSCYNMLDSCETAFENSRLVLEFKPLESKVFRLVK